MESEQHAVARGCARASRWIELPNSDLNTCHDQHPLRVDLGRKYILRRKDHDHERHFNHYKVYSIQEFWRLFANSRDRKYFGFVTKIHAAEVFPLVMSICIIIQGSIFALVGLAHPASIIFDGCSRIVQLVFPGMPYILERVRISR